MLSAVMRKAILNAMHFRGPAGGWIWPPRGVEAVRRTREGTRIVAPRGGTVVLDAPGVHTRNGDGIELHFQVPKPRSGRIALGFDGGFERVAATLEAKTGRLTLSSGECDRRQPIATARVKLSSGGRHVLRIEKSEGGGRLVKMADVSVFLDGRLVLAASSVNVPPEMGVQIAVTGGDFHLRRFVHRGVSGGVPEHLHVAGWQMLNEADLAGNLASIRRGVRRAAEIGARLLVTPETEADRRLRRFLRNTKNAPYVHHGPRLNEFAIDGVPMCMHVCHDGRYPELWTLPIMFGARVVVHPSNGGRVSGTVRTARSGTARPTGTMHAFYVHISGGGGSGIAGPRKYNNVLAVSDECRPDNPLAPQIGKPVECLIHADLRIHDAFGYWPVRSFRVSEEAAAAYVRLYRSLGGKNAPETGD